MKMNFSRVMGLMARRYGDREALVNVERNRRFSFRELHVCTNRIANMLRDTLGLVAGDRLMLILDNDNLSLLHFCTTWKQEATPVFTNYRDSPEEHVWQLELLKPRVVFIESSLVERYHGLLRKHGCTVVAMDPLPEPREDVLDFWTLVNAASPLENDCELDVHDHLAMLRFTGGTTGRGKCAMYSVDTLLGTRDGMLVHRDLAPDERTRFLHFAPLSHGSMMFFIPTLFVGGTNLTLSQPDLSQWRRAVESEQVTHSFLVPTLLYRLLDLQAEEPANLGSLETLVYGAAPMNPTRLKDLVRELGPIFAQIYGSTEAAMALTVLEKDKHQCDDTQAIARLASAGRISPGIEMTVVDDDGRELPAGQTGELMVRCRSLIKGYYANPEQTAAEFSSAGWKSGDVGYIDEDGYVFIVDRKKDMIISGGFNVYAVEVEAALGAHPAVLMSAVVGIPHPEWVEAVHAEVVLRPGQLASVEELIVFARQRVGGYKAPKSIVLVDALPVSAVGKVFRRKVREKYWRREVRALA